MFPSYGYTAKEAAVIQWLRRRTWTQLAPIWVTGGDRKRILAETVPMNQ